MGVAPRFLCQCSQCPFPSPPQALPGFTEEPAEPKFVLTGFARNAVLGVAGQVVDAVKQGHLKHIFLIGG